MVKSFYQLAKPGIIYGNVLTGLFGFFLATRGQFNIGLCVSMVIGLGLVIGSACVFNNVLDQPLDKVMKRTQKRPLISGEISQMQALIYGVILGVLGTAVLTFFANTLTAVMALAGFFFYVVAYSYCKRRSVYGTEVGCISGAMPPIVGYVAVTDKLDLGALILFLILVFWQVPHFYGLAIYKLKDYSATPLPLMPIKRGVQVTKVHMIYYLLAFLVTAPLLTIFGYTGKVYFGVVTLLAIAWLVMGLKGFKVVDEALWAKKVFLFSLVIIMALCVVTPLDTLFRI